MRHITLIVILIVAASVALAVGAYWGSGPVAHHLAAYWGSGPVAGLGEGHFGR